MSGWNDGDSDSLLDSGLDDEDFIDGIDDDEESETEHHDESPPPQHPIVTQPTSPVRAQNRKPSHTAGRKHRLRAMSPRMASMFPDMTSIVMTRRDGVQIMFVRKGGS